MKGALDVVLRHCTTIDGGELLTPALCDHYTSVARDYGHQGLRGERNTYHFVFGWIKSVCVCASSLTVVAMAYGRDLNNLSFTGLMAMWDPPREKVGVY